MALEYTWWNWVHVVSDNAVMCIARLSSDMVSVISDMPDDNLVITNSDGLVQERRNSSELAMELRLSCTNPSIYTM